MPITKRDVRNGAPPISRGIASLIGGMVIGVGCFILWLLVAGQLMNAPPTMPVIACGVLVCLGISIWIRVGDL